jgi:predicted DCC family thiol-disulfide oxidoreductase YuxK
MDKVIIFDSDCSLCLSVVRFIRKHNRKTPFHFVPQQSDEGRALVQKLSVAPKDINTVIYITETGYLVRSTAVLHILKDMGAPWKYFYFLRLVPVFIRDAVYRVVARLRGIIGGRVGGRA